MEHRIPAGRSRICIHGLGREAMSKVQAEPGDAPERDEDGNLVLSHTDNRWVGTGNVIALMLTDTSEGDFETSATVG